MLGTKMKKQGVMLEKKETIVESKLCKRGYTETTNYADGADHDADADADDEDDDDDDDDVDDGDDDEMIIK